VKIQENREMKNWLEKFSILFVQMFSVFNILLHLWRHSLHSDFQTSVYPTFDEASIFMIKTWNPKILEMLVTVLTMCHDSVRS